MSDYATFSFAPIGDGGTFFVGALTPVTLSMLTDLDLPAGTVIAIQMPIYNPEAPRTLRHSYLTSEEVSCSAELNAGESLYCEVDSVRGVDN